MLPYLEADFWKAFPKMPAWEFARFVSLAKSGRPFMGAMVIEDVPGNKPAVMQEAQGFVRIVPHDRGEALSRAAVALSSSGTATAATSAWLWCRRCSARRCR